MSEQTVLSILVGADCTLSCLPRRSGLEELLLLLLRAITVAATVWRLGASMLRIFSTSST